MAIEGFSEQKHLAVSGTFFRHPIVSGLVVTVVGAWVVTRCVHETPQVPAAAMQAEALSEIVIHTPRKLLEEPPEPVRADPLVDFNAWALMVRQLSKSGRFYEREEFLKGMDGKRVHWRGHVRNVYELDPGVGMILIAEPPADLYYRGFVVQFGHKMRTKAFALHDGDLIEVTGRYAGEEDTWGRPWIDGESLALVADSSVRVLSGEVERRE